jgi:thiamine phosphate synthase YjbQ (UPF0047 family)
MTGREKLMAMMREYQQRMEQYKTTADSIPAHVQAIRLTKRESHRYVIVHPSTQCAGRWQATYFDAYSPVGHITRDTRTDAMVDAMRDGYDIIAECA